MAFPIRSRANWHSLKTAHKSACKGNGCSSANCGEKKRERKREKTRERFQGSKKGSNKQLNLSVPVWLMETGEVIFTVGMPGVVLKKRE